MFKFAVLSLFVGLSVASKDYHSIELPVKSKHDLEVINTPSQEEEHSTYVDIPGGVLPVYMTFKTQSSPLYVKQQHRGTKGSIQKSDSKDEPHKLVHEVVKPVIQELKEIITPYRKVVQVIEAVKEERLTKVHKGERKSYGGYGDDGGYGKGDDGGYGKSDDNGYGKSDDNGYGKSDDNGYGKSDEEGYGKSEEKGYGKSNDEGYGKSDDGYGKSDRYGKSEDSYKGYSVGEGVFKGLTLSGY